MENPLHTAVMFGQLKVVSQLLTEGADVRAKDETVAGFTPLHIAAKLKYVNIAKLLLDNGADVNLTENDDSISPLHLACNRDYVENEDFRKLSSAKEVDVNGKKMIKMVKLLLTAGANVNAIDGGGNTPLHHACYKPNLSVVKLLVNAGADLNIENVDKKYTPLHMAVATSEDNLDSLKLLLDSGANVNAKDVNGRTTLHWSMILKNINTLKMLIDAGADLNAVDNQNRTVLHSVSTKCINENDINFLKVLLNAGINLLIKDKNDYTPLHCATLSTTSSSFIKHLIDAGSDVNAKTTKGFTPLHLAARKSKNLNVLKVLLKAGANVNAKDDHDNTPLFDAASLCNNANMLKLLISAGADVSAKGKDGCSALHVAAFKSKNVNILKLLVESGIDVNTVDSKGSTPLHYSLTKDVLRNSKFLIEAGANVNARDDSNETPLQIACYSKHMNIMKLLIDAGANINELIIRNGDVTFDYFVQGLHLVHKNKNMTEETFKSIIESLDINLVDKDGENIFTKIEETFLSSVQIEFFVKLIIEHISKLKVLNFQLNSSLVDYISRTAKRNEYFLKCVEELERAKSMRLYNSWVTLLNLIVDDQYKFVKYAGNEDLIDDFKITNLKKFSVFGELIKKNVNKGIYGRKLFDNAASLFSDYLPIFNPTHLIVRDILNNLSEEDWKNLSVRKRYRE